jgi:hypothetical protein
METYRILLGPILDGAGLHEEDGTISLAEAEAAPLVELGIIEEIPGPPAKAGRTTKAAD